MKKLIIVIVGVVVLGVVVGLILRGGNRADAEVEMATVSRENLTATVSCSGTIQPQRSVDVSANVIGTITRLAAVEGQTVQTGDFLLEIDPTEYESAVRALAAAVESGEADLRLADASLEKARQDLDRASELHRQGLASQEQLDAARTNARIEAARVEAARSRLLQVQANLDKAQYDLTKVTMTAPMSGVITRLNVEQGENAIMGTLNNPGTVLLTIADLTTMEAWVRVDETEVVKMALGQPVKVEIDAFPDREYAGTVTEIGNSPLFSNTGANQQAVDFEVKVTLADMIENIRPGLSAKADVTVAERQDALAVPLGAVTVRRFPLTGLDRKVYSGRRGKQQRDALGWRHDSEAADAGDTTTVDNGDTTLARHSADPVTDPTGNPTSETAEVERKETEGVFVIVDGFATFRPVKLGIAGEDHFEVLEGLEAEQRLVGGPFRVLRDLREGTFVKEVEKKDRGGDS